MDRVKRPLTPEEIAFLNEVGDHVMMRAEAAGINPALVCVGLGRTIGLLMAACGVSAGREERAILDDVLHAARTAAADGRAMVPDALRMLGEAGHA